MKPIDRVGYALKKYQDYAVLKLSQAIQATVDSNWTNTPPSIEVNFGEIAHYDIHRISPNWQHHPQF